MKAPPAPPEVAVKPVATSLAIAKRPSAHHAVPPIPTFSNNADCCKSWLTNFWPVPRTSGSARPIAATTRPNMSGRQTPSLRALCHLSSRSMSRMSPNPAAAVRIDSKKNAPSWRGSSRLYEPACNDSAGPMMLRLVTAATTEAITTVDRWRTAKLPKTTSSAKNIPAIGALKVAPIPAAAPAATRLRI